jgi:hypothetical protein
MLYTRVGGMVTTAEDVLQKIQEWARGGAS